MWTTRHMKISGRVMRGGLVDDARGPGDGTRVCCDGRVGGWWTKSCWAAGVEQCELNGGPCVQFQQGRAAGGGQVCKDAVGGERMRDASKAPPVRWA